MINQKLLRQAYRIAYGYADETKIDIPEGLIKLIEEYQMLDALESFQQTSAVCMPFDRPVKKAKEIALEAAIKIVGSDAGSFTIGDKTYKPGERTLSVAEDVYQWLIKQS